MPAFLIPGLPDDDEEFGVLSVVPSWSDDAPVAWNDAAVDQGGRAGWRDWRRRLDLYRTWIFNRCNEDPLLQQQELQRCVASAKYFLAVYGWIFEPRDHVDPDYPEPGWRPWALMPHQILLLDEIEAAMMVPSPAGDIIVEKSRDMGATWTFCGWIAWKWLFAFTFTAGLMSYREDEVVEDHPDSMMFKVKSILGLAGQAPGLPGWLFPEVVHGGDFANRRKELDHRATLAHPTRTNFLRGETMTEIAGTGNRTTVRLHDEAAKWRKRLRNVMTNTASVTQHRFVLSSAYTDFGYDFKNMVDFARSAAQSGQRAPRLIRLDAKLHPLHDDAWLANEKAKALANDDLEGFEREIEISYRAGSQYIYTELVEACPVLPDLIWEPHLKTYVSIDPGLADLCAITVAQVEPKPNDPDPLWRDRRPYDVRWLDSFAMNGQGVDFWAHVLTGILPDPGDSAYAAFFDQRGSDRRAHRLRDFMDFMGTLPWDPTLVYWCGDPAGGHREQTSKTTWYRELANHSRRLRTRRVEQRRKAGEENLPRPISIYPLCRDLFKYRSYHERQQHMRPVLRRSSFASSPGALAAREAFLAARRLDPTPRQTTDPGMEHNDAFNTTSAGEFFAVFLRLGLGVTPEQKREKEKDAAMLMGLPPGVDVDKKRRRAA